MADLSAAVEQPYCHPRACTLRVRKGSCAGAIRAFQMCGYLLLFVRRLTGGRVMAHEAIDDSILLTDSARNVSVKDWKTTSDDSGIASAGPRWSVIKRVLAGGRQEGVEVIDVDNGVMKFTVVPSRGFQVWTAAVGNLRLGWDSPVTEIVHPQFVNLAERGGFGWLNGFGEWISRCGLESMGPPCKDGKQTYTLQTQVLMPTFSPAGGSYTSAQSLTISEATPSSQIYYTTDGTTPSPGVVALRRCRR